MPIPTLVVLHKSCGGLKDVYWLGLFFLKAKPVSGVPNGPSHRRPSLHILPCESILQLSSQVVKVLHHSSTFLQPSVSHRPNVSSHGTPPEHMPDRFISLSTYCTQRVSTYFLPEEVGASRENIIARSPYKIPNLWWYIQLPNPIPKLLFFPHRGVLNSYLSLEVQNVILRGLQECGLDRPLRRGGPIVSPEGDVILRGLQECGLDRPLRRGGPIVSPEGDEAKVVFQYERPVGWCFACGKIGHEMKECKSANEKNKNEKPYGEWLKAGTRLKPEVQKSKPRSPNHHREDRTVTAAVSEPPPLTVDPTVTCSMAQETTEIPETPRPSPTPTVQLFMQSINPLASPFTLPADPILTDSNIMSNQNQTSMETGDFEGELYCMPVSYGKTTAIVTSSSTSPCTPSEDPQVKQKATWKKLARPKQNSATSHTTAPAGKKRRPSHANSHAGQEIGDDVKIVEID
ncbi:hypothetical protein SO802_013336 [Lithocarpus litseifolius]|uniref:CCHC-type domain-containing protein n=1 Tax=Lithocarpus litseifolius TaxID=425828 RepID=A0AAW2D5C6_9ROSI